MGKVGGGGGDTEAVVCILSDFDAYNQTQRSTVQFGAAVLNWPKPIKGVELPCRIVLVWVSTTSTVWM